MSKCRQPASFAKRTAIRLVVGATGGVITLFHFGLLIERLRTASLGDPRVAISWLAAVGLIGFGALVHSKGRSILSGRTGLAFWLLVLLLHLGVTPAAPLALRAEQLLGLPLDFAAAALAGIALSVLLGFTISAAKPAPGLVRKTESRRRRLALGALPSRFASRPPPLHA